MKYTIPAVFAALTAVVAAQEPITSLPQCAQTCVNNMLGQASQLGCTSGDGACLCRNPEFQNSIRDCDNEYCGAIGNNANAQAGIAWGNAYCAAALNAGGASSSAPDSTSIVDTTTVLPSSSTGTVPIAIPITTSTIVSDGNTVGTTTIFSTAAGSAGLSAISTIESTLTTDGSTETTAISTIFTSVASAPGGVGVGGGAGGSSSTSSGEESSTSTGEEHSSTSTGEEHSSTTSGAGAGAHSTSSSATAKSSSTESHNAAAMQTVFPGLAAAAGIAAFLI